MTLRRGDVVAAEASHGLLLLAGLGSVVVTVALSLVAKPDATQWADRSTLSSLLCVFTGPVLGGVAGIVAGARMAGLSETAASTTAGARFPAQIVLLAALCWVVPVSIAQAIAPLVARSPWGSQLGMATTLPWLQTLALLMACTSMGVAAGVRWHTWLVGPTAAAAIFGWLYFTTFLPGRWNLVAPVDNSSFYRPWTEPRPSIILAHTGLSLAVVLAVVALLTQVQVRRRILAGAALVLVLACVGTLFTTSADRTQPRRLTTAPACAQSRGVQFCAWPSLSSQTPLVAAALAAARSQVEEQWEVPHVFTQEGLPQEVTGSRMQLGIPVSQETVGMDAIHAVLPTCSATRAGDDARAQLLGWMTARLGVDKSVDSPFRSIASADRSAQHTWVKNQLAAGGCQ